MALSPLGLLFLRDLLPAWVLAAWFGVVVFVPLFLLLLASLKRWGKVRKAPEFLPTPPPTIPADLTRFSQPWLGRLGFLGHQVIQILHPAGEKVSDTVTWVLPNKQEKTLALLTGIIPPSGRRPGFALRVVSFLADGRVVVTADHPVTHRTPGHWALVQRSFSMIDEQLQVHRTQVEAMAGGVEAILPGPAEIPAWLATQEQAVNEALVKYGDYRTSGEREIRPALFRAPALVLRDFFDRRAGFLATSATKKDVASMDKAESPGEEESAPPVGSLKLSLEEQVEQDIGRYRKHADQPAGIGHVVLRLMLLIATLLAFTALFGREHLTLTVGMLLGLVAVHEFGHWVMMKLFGYRRMGRFFVPFVAPIHLGRKLNASPWQQMLVILAGPLPGMLFGSGVMIAGFLMSDLPAWLRELGGLALALNAFHLLPFLPLDGGKMVDLLIFRDLPLLRPLFTIVSAAATFAASFPLKSRAVRAIAIAMFTGIAWDIKMIGMVRGGRRIDWAGTVDDENEALQRIFRGIREEDNEDFLRSKGWQQKIDVLLAEVMRKRPGFGFRFLGGGVYWWSCALSIGLIGLLFTTKFIGSAGQLPTLAKHVAEFRGSFPVEERPLTQEQFNAIKELVTHTRDAIGQNKGTPHEQAALLTPETGAALDHLDWTAAGIALHCDEIDSTVLAVWLESQCGKMEAAVKSGQHAEGLLRAEILLHGVSALEPLRLLDFREPAWNAQLRTLTAVEQLAATGKLDAATLQRLDARVSALNKAPAPNVDCLLLVSSWGDKQAEAAMVDAVPDDGKEPVFDARFWNLATPQMLRLFDNVKAFGKSTPATVAVARYWKKTGRVGGIPAKLEGSDKVSPAPGEAEFIAAYCEKQQQITWRRITTLAALRMESYRLKNGKLPAHWKYSIPDGGALSLDESAGPCLKLVDQRKLIQPIRFPDWMGPMQNPNPIEYTCPLNPAPELSKK